MSNALYTRFQTLMTNLLQSRGKSVSLRVVSSDPYDPTTGVKIEESTDTDVQVLMFPIRANHINIENVRFGDQEAFLSVTGVSITPTVKEKLIEWSSSTAWTISASVQISFDLTNKRITDESGSNRFSNAVVGQKVVVSGSISNDGTFVINQVATDGSYIRVTNQDVVVEAAGESITLIATSVETTFQLVTSAQKIKPANVVIGYQVLVREIAA